MAYNPFPMNYQPAYYPQQQYPQQQFQQQQQQQYQQPMTPPTIHAEIVQVDSEQAAENYPLSAGASQMMIAKDDRAIYVKSMYANGQYNLDVFVKRPHTEKKPEVDLDKYITREEFERRIKALMKEDKKDVVRKTRTDEQSAR